MVSDSLWPRGLYSPWNSLGQNTGMGSLSLLQGFFPTQGSSPGLTHCRWIIYKLSHKGSSSYVRGKSKRSLPTLVSKSYKSPGRDRNVWLGWKADWFWLKGNRLCFAQCGLKPLLKVVVVELLSHVWLFVTPWTVAYYAPPSMGFSRQEYWSGLPFPSPGDLPGAGIEPRSPALQADSLTIELSGKPSVSTYFKTILIKICFFFFNLTKSFSKSQSPRSLAFKFVNAYLLLII